MTLYRIRKADQQEYGPASADDLCRWIRDGQVFERTLVKLEGTADWKQLSQFPEFSEALAAAATMSGAESAPPLILPPAPREPALPGVEAIESRANASGWFARASLLCMFLGIGGGVILGGGPYMALAFLCVLVTGIAAVVTAIFAYGRSRAKRDLAPGCVGFLFLMLIAAIILPGFVPAKRTARKNACINNLRQIEGAKDQWALDNKKSPGDIPLWNDLVGTNHYLKAVPTCPLNGTYTINDMATQPACSIPDHTQP